MKNKLLVLYILYSTITFSQSKYGVVEYGKKSLTTSDLTKSQQRLKEQNPEKYKKFQKMRDIIANGEKKITFTLKFKNNEGSFSAKPMLKSDNPRSYKRALGPYDSGVYYNNLLRVLQLNAFGELFLISKPEIGNYLCYKADAEVVINSVGKKRLITAWFALEIPISLGPIGYNGLPGLILELETNKKIYFAKKISLNSNEPIEILKPTKGLKVTESEFQNIASKAMKALKKGM